MNKLIEVTSNDNWFKEGEILWIEYVASGWRTLDESLYRLSGTSVIYTTYKELSKETNPEYFL